MSPAEPAWWYAERPGPIASLLSPLSHLYSAAGARRFATAAPYRCALPVFCVGNFTAGGTGKSPVTADLVGRLAAAGMPPAVLTRGFGGRIAGPHWVDLERDRARDVGDEPISHARRVPVMVARDRAAGALAIADDPRGFGAVVMDDGLQNPHLQKDWSCAVVDARRGLGNGRVIPAGPLRMPLAAQMPLVDAILLNLGDDPAAAAQAAERQRTYFAARFDGPVLSFRIAPSTSSHGLAGQRVAAFAGIANPTRFFGLLRRLGAEVTAERAFADHHPFSEADAKALLAWAGKERAVLVTTEKDHARLTGARDGALCALAAAAQVLAITTVFEPACDLRLSAMIESVRARADRYSAGRRSPRSHKLPDGRRSST